MKTKQSSDLVLAWSAVSHRSVSVRPHWEIRVSRWHFNSPNDVEPSERQVTKHAPPAVVRKGDSSAVTEHRIQAANIRRRLGVNEPRELTAHGSSDTRHLRHRLRLKTGIGRPRAEDTNSEAISEDYTIKHSSAAFPTLR